jgi:hypothetical protein
MYAFQPINDTFYRQGIQISHVRKTDLRKYFSKTSENVQNWANNLNTVEVWDLRSEKILGSRRGSGLTPPSGLKTC